MKKDGSDDIEVEDRVAAAVRRAAGENVFDLAREFGVDVDTIEAWHETLVIAAKAALVDTPDDRRYLQRVLSRREELADVPLRDFLVEWDNITADEVEAFEIALDTARREEDLQRYLTAHPRVLVQPLGGGHGRWVIPKKRLGSEYVTDFLVGERFSSGFAWVAVEIESPLAVPYTKKSDESAALNHARRQIDEWRVWLKANQNYASRSRAEEGLGLEDIDPGLRGVIVIGREGDYPDETHGRRRAWSTTYGIDVHSWDWLLREAQGRVAALRRAGF